jgi:Carboxypeptidase regulatory-like domain
MRLCEYKSRLLSLGLRAPLEFVILALIFSLPSQIFAQSKQSGEIRGTVTDTSGSVVPAVTVTIINDLTGVSQVFTTDASGIYEAPFVQPGTYTITFSQSAFKTLVRRNIELHVETIKVDAELQVGAITETVSVTAGAPLVQTENAEKNLTLSTQAVSDIPNVGRSWDQLLGLLPGVNGGGGSTATGQGIGLNGQTAYQSNWQIDGGIAMLGGSQNPDILQPPLDSIAELDLSTANFGADRGTGLSVFNVTTKSGTNEFHGDVFEYVENDIFSAHNFFDTPGSKIPPLRWNEFGYTLGGPIKKNKLFFFTDFQMNPTTTPSTNFYTYPTNKMLSGDFSQLCTTLQNPQGSPGAGQPATFVGGICTNPAGQLYDPATTATVNGAATRQPFLGNIIPQDRLDPVAAAILKYYPAAQNQNLIANNYIVNISNAATTKWFDVKMDYDISPENRLSGSVGIVRLSNPLADPISIDNALVTDHAIHAQITDVWTISPTKINEFRYSFTHQRFFLSSNTLDKGYPAKIGLNNAADDLFPEVYIAGINPIGMSPYYTAGQAVDAESTFIPSDVFTWVKGKNIFKFGGEAQWWQVNTGWPLQDAGSFDFGGITTFTNNPVDGTGGYGLADFYLGLSDSWSVAPQVETGSRSWSAQSFAQDEYKLRPNLTVTVGLRYIIQSGWSEVNNKMLGFQPSVINPADNTPGALWYAGQLGHSSLTNTVYDFFAPRLGFAWSLGKDTSVRGGFGVYNTVQGWGTHTTGGFVGTAGWAPFGQLQTVDQLTPIFQLAQGPPPATIPTATTRTPDMLNGATVYYAPFNTPLSYAEEYSLGIEHQLKGGFALDVGYVGNRGIHLPYTRNIDQVPLADLGPGDLTSKRPYPNYYAIYAAYFDGISNYNALQVTAKNRMSHGLLFTVNYTWSKTMDEITNSGFAGGGLGHAEHGGALQNAYDPRSNYGASSLNITQFFNGGVVYELPFGKGKYLLDRVGILNAIVGGWEVTSLFQVHSGLPFTPVWTGFDYANSGGPLRPDRIGSGKLAHPTIAKWFDPSAFTEPALYTFGNSGRNILYGPGYANVDAGVLKNFAISKLGEQARFQFKAEISNVLNHPNFGLPDAGINPNSTTVGTITSATPGRTMQLGAKLTF